MLTLVDSQGPVCVGARNPKLVEISFERWWNSHLHAELQLLKLQFQLLVLSEIDSALGLLKLMLHCRLKPHEFSEGAPNFIFI